jgi:hypothetical protein
MEFKISLEIDIEAENKRNVIISLSQELNYFFKSRNYGKDVNHFLLGCICIKTKEGYENWYKIRKPKYIDYKKNKNRITGVEIEINKTYECDFKIDNEVYDDFVSVDEISSKKILASEILKSLSILDSFPKKLDFDKISFKADMEFFFNEKGLI